MPQTAPVLSGAIRASTPASISFLSAAIVSPEFLKNTVVSFMR
jgi:hypothetical protein